MECYLVIVTIDTPIFSSKNAYLVWAVSVLSAIGKVPVNPDDTEDATFAVKSINSFFNKGILDLQNYL